MIRQIEKENVSHKWANTELLRAYIILIQVQSFIPKIKWFRRNIHSYDVISDPKVARYPLRNGQRHRVKMCIFQHIWHCVVKTCASEVRLMTCASVQEIWTRYDKPQPHLGVVLKDFMKSRWGWIAPKHIISGFIWEDLKWDAQTIYRAI